jgi:hypothetical protein
MVYPVFYEQVPPNSQNGKGESKRALDDRCRAAPGASLDGDDFAEDPVGFDRFIRARFCIPARHYNNGASGGVNGGDTVRDRSIDVPVEHDISESDGRSVHGADRDGVSVFNRRPHARAFRAKLHAQPLLEQMGADVQERGCMSLHCPHQRIASFTGCRTEFRRLSGETEGLQIIP